MIGKGFFGIWYDDGAYDCGWLGAVGGNGQAEHAEYFSREEAERQAAFERSADRTVIFAALSRDEATAECTEYIRKIAVANRVHLMRRKIEELESDK